MFGASKTYIETGHEENTKSLIFRVSKEMINSI